MELSQLSFTRARILLAQLIARTVITLGVFMALCVERALFFSWFEFQSVLRFR